MITQKVVSPAKTSDETPVIKVHIVKDSSSDYGVRIDASHPTVGGVRRVLPFMPKEHQKMLASYIDSTLDYAISRFEDRIPYIVWQGAIAAEIANSLAKTTPEPTVVKGFSADTYMAMGDHVYRLQPVAIASSTKALQIVRKRATEAARAEGDRILADAKLSVEGVVTEAHKRLAEANDLMTKAKDQRVPPEWCIQSKRAVRFNSTTNLWEVGFLFNFYIGHFSFIANNPAYRRELPVTIANAPHLRKVWTAAINSSNYFPVHVWTPVNPDGTYRVNTTTLAPTCKGLPHMKQTASCLAPAANPERILGEAEALQWQGALQRVNSGVDLGSLLSLYSYWDKRAQAFCPPALAEILSHEGDYITRLNAATAPTVEPYLTSVDAAQTFDVRAA